MTPRPAGWPAVLGASLYSTPGDPRPPGAGVCIFGDGGNLDNQGIVPLLRRGLKKMIAFVYTETQLSVQGPKHEGFVDSYLPPLFGLEWSSMREAYVPISPSSPFRFNQVFDRATFDDFRNQLWTRAQAGATAMALQENAPVAANPHYGAAATSTDILWIYLNPVGWWQSHLHESVRLETDLEPWNYAMATNYYTVGQLHLDVRQVNLVAVLGAWAVAGGAHVRKYEPNFSTCAGMLGA